MANGVWVPCHDSIREHRKTYALAEILKIETYSAVGIVMSISAWALSSGDDGNIGVYPAEAVARAVGWKKNPSRLIDALIESGWIDKREDGLYIHDFDEYTAKLVARRKKDRDRQRAYRDSHADVTRDITRDITRDVTQKKSLRHGATQHNTDTTIKDIPPKPPNGEYDDSKAFFAFWSVYPKKVDKPAAIKAWGRRVRPGDVDAIIAGVKRDSASTNWTREGGQYIPNPATWLNGERWKDEGVSPEIAGVSQKKKNPALNYPQRPVTDDDEGVDWL